MQVAFQEELEAATEEVKKYEEEHRSLGNIDHLHQRKRELDEKLRANKNKLLDIKVCHHPFLR